MSGSREQFAALGATASFPWRLTAFAVGLFAFALLAFLGIRFGYRAYLDRQIESVDAETKGLAVQVNADEQERFTVLYSQLLHLKSVLEKHLFTANAFPFLERYTASGLTFNDADLKVNDLKLTLNGVATTFETVAGQMAVFEQAREVRNVTLEKVNLATGNVSFTIGVVFKPEAFLKPVP